MPGEKKYWGLSSPFRRSSEKQDPGPQSKIGSSRNRVSNVYLSDDTSSSGFVVVPEFDGSVPTLTTHASEESVHSTHLQKLPVATSSHPMFPNGVDSYFYDLEPTSFDSPSYHRGGSFNPTVPITNWDDDLSQRLDSAYEHIRSMPCAVPPKAILSSDPQMLRKQLGVPQHSVLNYPIHSSPDLPNPHISPCEPASPELPPNASPDVTHATPKKFDLCINTNIYPISPPHVSSPPFQLAQKKSMVTVPTLTEKPAFDPSGTHITCTRKHPSRLVEPDAEEPLTLPSSLPPSRRQISRGVLRKPAFDTPLSTSANTWQNSVPRIKSPSPLNMDIPLHHAWHERRTSFDSFLKHSKKVHFHETKSRRTRGNTEALAALAWTGTVPMTSSSFTAEQSLHLVEPAYLPDRLRSMSIAVEDDSISDDALVDRLEKVRRIGSSSECGRDTSPSTSLISASPLGSAGHECLHLDTSYLSSLSPSPMKLAKSSDAFLPSPLISQDMLSDKEDAEVWQAARKAFLCIREIVRTENKYQEALKMLLNAQTATPPPPSMDPYISALVRSSEMLLKCFLEDPSVWGVSAAFVTSEDDLEAAMVSWCAVAGTFFIDGNDSQSFGLIGRWRHRKSGMVLSPPAATKQASLSLSPRLPPIFPMTSTTGKINQRVYEEYGARKCPKTDHERQSTSVHQQKPEESQPLTGQLPSRKPSVRDLAIQPIQRVMRYVLLYRDLQDCTPPASPSRILVERALEAATRIANHCDRAQRNPAFFRAS